MKKGGKSKNIALRFLHVLFRCFTCCCLSNEDVEHVKREKATEKDCSKRVIPQTKYLKNSSHSSILRGSKHQGQMNSIYSGNQCTSIAIYSLFAHMIMRVDSWITDSIDSILVLGTELHKYFREVAKLSTNPDRRVALDDIPDDFFVNESYRGRSLALGYGLVRCMDDNTDLQVFPDLKRFLEDCFAQGLSSIVVTVGDFSVSIIEHAGGFWLFDSHACDQAGGKSLLSFQEGKACLLSFPTLQSLVTHIQIQFGNEQYVGRAFSFCHVDSLGQDKTPSHQDVDVETLPTPGSKVSAVEETMEVLSAELPKDDCLVDYCIEEATNSTDGTEEDDAANKGGKTTVEELDAEPEAEPDVPPQAEPDVPPQAEPDVPPQAEPDVPPQAEPDVPPQAEPDVPPQAQVQGEVVVLGERGAYKSGEKENEVQFSSTTSLSLLLKSKFAIAQREPLAEPGQIPSDLDDDEEDEVGEEDEDTRAPIL